MDKFKDWPLTGWYAPIRGFLYFLTTPSLWWRPLFSALFIFLLLMSLFFFVTYFFWPKEFNDWLNYLIDVSKSLGYSIGALVLFWVMGLPLLLTYFFSTFIKAILRREKLPCYEETFSEVLHGALFILVKTMKWRIFWPIVSIFCTLFLGPVGFFIAHFGLGHILAIDSFDLALSYEGLKPETRLKIIKKAPLFAFACTSAFISLVLSFTFLGLLFWFPSMIIGSIFLSKNYAAKIKSSKL
jgi:hypothetical protein